VRRRGCSAGWTLVVREKGSAIPFPIRCNPSVSTWLVVAGSFEVACLNWIDLLGLAWEEIVREVQT
jgi:hypothetical protein